MNPKYIAHYIAANLLKQNECDSEVGNVFYVVCECTLHTEVVIEEILTPAPTTYVE